MKRKIVLLFACLSVGVLSAQEDMHDLAPLADDTWYRRFQKMRHLL